MSGRGMWGRGSSNAELSTNEKVIRMRVHGCFPKAAFVLATLIASLAPAGSVSASEGVREINQACAQTGCFPGDTAGFPVSIVSGGAYRLTSNLVVGGGTSIEIVATRSTDIDLNGFAVRGPGSCTGRGGGVACSGLAGIGLDVSLFTFDFHVHVHGGSISGFQDGIRVSTSQDANGELRLSELLVESSGTGVLLASTGDSGQKLVIESSTVRSTSGSCIFHLTGPVEVRGSRLIDCHDSGAVTNDKLSISGSRIERVGLVGLHVGDDSVVRDVEVVGSSTGILCGRACMVSKTLVSKGSGRGIQAGFVSSIVDNVVDFNAGVAIEASDGSTIRGNSVGAATGAGVAPGIRCGTGCNVLDNVVRNSSQPLNLGAESSYRRNVFSFYPGAPVVGSGVSGGDNLCAGTSC